MIVLLLGPFRQRMVDFIIQNGDSVQYTESKITPDMPVVVQADWLISFGYRYIIRQEVLRLFDRKAINLHISYLPWNRGADPNLWSFLDNTPKGVTIHFIDHSLDTGDIVAQKSTGFACDETLRTTYEQLNTAIENLFFDHWDQLKKGLIEGTPQEAGGTVHRSIDKERYRHLLAQGWDTPVSSIIGKAS